MRRPAPVPAPDYLVGWRGAAAGPFDSGLFPLPRCAQKCMSDRRAMRLAAQAWVTWASQQGHLPAEWLVRCRLPFPIAALGVLLRGAGRRVADGTPQYGRGHFRRPTGVRELAAPNQPDVVEWKGYDGVSPNPFAGTRLPTGPVVATD